MLFKIDLETGNENIQTNFDDSYIINTHNVSKWAK